MNEVPPTDPFDAPTDAMAPVRQPTRPAPPRRPGSSGRHAAPTVPAPAPPPPSQAGRHAKPAPPYADIPEPPGARDQYADHYLGRPLPPSQPDFPDRRAPRPGPSESPSWLAQEPYGDAFGPDPFADNHGPAGRDRGGYDRDQYGRGTPDRPSYDQDPYDADPWDRDPYDRDPYGRAPEKLPHDEQTRIVAVDPLDSPSDYGRTLHDTPLDQVSDDDDAAADGAVRIGGVRVSRRTAVLAAFAALGLLALGGVGAFAMSKFASPEETSASGTSSSTVTETTTPATTQALTTSRVAPPPPPPSSGKPTTTKPSTTTTTSSPPPPPPAQQGSASGHISGTIVSKDSTTWTVNTSGGPVKVAINANTNFAGSNFGVGSPVSVDGQQFGDTLLATTVTAGGGSKPKRPAQQQQQPPPQDPSTTESAPAAEDPSQNSNGPYVGPDGEYHRPGYY